MLLERMEPSKSSFWWSRHSMAAGRASPAHRKGCKPSSGLPQLRSLLRLLSFSHCPPDFPRPQRTSRSYIWTSSSMKLTGNIPLSSLRQLGPFTMQESSALLCKMENRFYRSDALCVFLLTLVKGHTTSDRLRIE